MQFNLKPQNDFKNNIRREWALTNGLGGYAGGSVTGAINRTHQGYLIASLHAPVQRYVCFSKTNEKIVTDSHTYDLSSDQFKGGCHTDGIQYIRDFTYDGTICFTYEAGDITIKKHIALAQGKNLAAVAYEVQNKGEAAKLLITPLMNFREHSESSKSRSMALVSSQKLMMTTVSALLFQAGSLLKETTNISVTLRLRPRWTMKCLASTVHFAHMT